MSSSVFFFFFFCFFFCVFFFFLCIRIDIHWPDPVGIYQCIRGLSGVSGGLSAIDFFCKLPTDEQTDT